MAERRDLGLRRGVGLGLLASVLLVNLSMAVFVSIGVVAGDALGATPFVFVVAGFVFLLTLLAYVEGMAMLPQAGGSAGFARRGLGEIASFLAGWALILDYLILVVLTAYFAVHYLGSIPRLEALLADGNDALASAALVVAVVVLVLRGVKAGSSTAIAVALAALVAQVLLAALGLLLVFEPRAISSHLELGVTPTWEGLLFALPLAMIGFTGLDSVANLGGELAKPGRDVPRPLIWSAVVSVAMFVVMSVVALNALPVVGGGSSATTQIATDTGYVDRPVVGITEQLGLPGGVETALVVLLALLAASVLFLAASSAVNGLGRIAWYMSLHRQAPSALVAIDRRTGVPRRAIAVLSLAALGLLAITASLRESALALVQVYAFGATFTATLACGSVLLLRITEPDLPRPWRVPGDVLVGGRRINVLLVAGTLSMATMWLIVLATHEDARVVGLTWMIFGFVAYGTYRLTHGLPLNARADPRVAQPLNIDATTYRRVLVAVRPAAGMLYGAGDAELIGLANKLVERRPADDSEPGAAVERPRVTVMLVHELPLTEPLDAELGDREEATMRRLARIRQASDKLGLRVSSSVTRARAAGRAICQEAERREADLVLLATRTKRRHGDDVFGRCVTYVMRHAPCDVVVLCIPEATLRAAVPQPVAALEPSDGLASGHRRQ